MVVAIIGLNNIYENDGVVEYELEKIFNNHFIGKKVHFMIGGCQNFDKIALTFIRGYKNRLDRVKISFVFCNLTFNCLEELNVDKEFDNIILRENKNCTLRQAFINNYKYMVENAEMVLTYNTLSTYTEKQVDKHVKSLGKEYINVKEKIYE